MYCHYTPEIFNPQSFQLILQFITFSVRYCSKDSPELIQELLNSAIFLLIFSEIKQQQARNLYGLLIYFFIYKNSEQKNTKKAICLIILWNYTHSYILILNTYQSLPHNTLAAQHNNTSVKPRRHTGCVSKQLRAFQQTHTKLCGLLERQIPYCDARKF